LFNRTILEIKEKTEEKDLSEDGLARRRSSGWRVGNLSFVKGINVLEVCFDVSF